MGVWAFGPDPTKVDVAGIAEAMRPALYAWMSAHVTIYDPKRSATPAYDPNADSGGLPAQALVLDTGADGALVQPIRSPQRADVGGQASGLLGIRFQLRRDVTTETGTKLRGGLIVRVVDGGNDPELVGPAFSLMEVFDSSLAWGRIYDAVVVTGGQ